MEPCGATSRQHLLTLMADQLFKALCESFRYTRISRVPRPYRQLVVQAMAALKGSNPVEPSEDLMRPITEKESEKRTLLEDDHGIRKPEHQRHHRDDNPESDGKDR